MSELLKEWADLYRKTLLEDVIPFWVKYAVDRETRSINNCIDDSGKVLSKNKYLWSQGRALWTFSALYNRIEKKPEWLNIAEGLFGYLSTRGRDNSGKWMFLLDEQGNVIEGDKSIYVDGFVLNGMCEYFLATGEPKAAEIALETYKNTLWRLQHPGSYGIEPYFIPEGMKTHGINMIFSFFYYNLGIALGEKSICETAYDMAIEILSDFYLPDKDVIVEYVSLEGKPIDSSLGRVCVPGHVLESMWFLISIFEHTGDNKLIAECCRLIKRHLELGWDEEYGGITLALDIEGKESVAWKNPTCKPWWAQVEALVATAYALKHTGKNWYIDWHKRIQEYAFKHYPSEHGEWIQWLDRYGNKAESAALPVKDPFHLPRGLIYLINLLK